MTGSLSSLNHCLRREAATLGSLTSSGYDQLSVFTLSAFTSSISPGTLDETSVVCWITRQLVHSSVIRQKLGWAEGVWRNKDRDDKDGDSDKGGVDDR